MAKIHEHWRLNSLLLLPTAFTTYLKKLMLLSQVTLRSISSKTALRLLQSSFENGDSAVVF